MATILYNLAFNYTDFLTGSTISSFQLIRGYATFLCLVFVYGICYFKSHKLSRLSFIAYHLSFSLLTLFGALSSPGSLLYTKIPVSQQIYNETLVFLKLVILLYYCEFYMCLLFHFPFYMMMQCILSYITQIQM
jgi:hypothetical protein